MKKYFKFFVNAAVIFLVAMFQIGFVSALPPWMSNVNIALIAVVYILLIFGEVPSLKWAVSIGLILDIFSSTTFGVYLLSLVLVAIVGNFLLINSFTDRSLYSFMAMIFFSGLVYLVSTNIIIGFAQFLSLKKYIIFNIDYFLSVFWQFVLNLVVMFVLFHITNYLSRSFKPVFLARSNKI